MSEKIFRLVKTTPTVNYYEPTIDLYVPAINPNGEIQLKKVINFSVHKNTETVILKHDSFGEIHVTKDHSILVYDKQKEEVYPVSPMQLETLKQEEGRYFFIQFKQPDNLDPDKTYTLNDTKLIPIEEIIVEEGPVQDTYDFFIKDYKTFAIDNGLFVQDTVAVYMPLTKEAQEEAKKKMFRKAISIATDEPLFEFAQGMVLGLYLLTKDDKPKTPTTQRPKSLDPKTLKEWIFEDPDRAYLEITYNGPKVRSPIKTTLGRVLVNQMLPTHVPFFDVTLNKKNLKKLLSTLADYVKQEQLIDLYDELRQLGFDFASRTGISMPIDEFILPIEFKKEAEKLKQMSPEKGMKYIDQVLLPKLKEYVKKHYPQIYAIFDSGARGSWSDLMQMVLVKGYVEDAEGKVVKVPVAKGFVDNLNAVEAFIISPAARVGIINRSIRTAEGGYLTRRLVKAAATIKIDFSLKDCRTDRFLEITVHDEDWAKAIIGRYLHDGTLITKDNYKEFIGQTIKLRSPIFCKSPKICLKCYGELYKLLTSDSIGINSAQIVGERGTQLIMKTFHTGGLAEISELPQVIDHNETKNLVQDGDKIITKQPCKVTISKEESEYKLFEDKVVLESGIAHVEFKDGTYYDIDLQDDSYTIQFINFLDMKASEDKVVLTYDSDQVIGELELMSQGFGQTLTIANKLFERRLCKECDITETLERIFELYKSFGRKLVHFEVVLSNMVRSKSNLYIPYRLSNDKEYTIIGISQVPFYTSPLLALAFQNVGKAIESGLLMPEEMQSYESEFDKILLGEFTKRNK